ncbi:hypothetical protein BDZ97DRAFT_783013 [Flammula alnicola]|nr:hypothetical protein BDZ97DRAFT_783013 [Flammula alnicola]
MTIAHGPHAHHYVGYETIEARLYISLASVVCLLWEYVLTLSHEYTYIWKSQLTVTKWLYLLLRYVPLICQVANHIVTRILFSKRPLSPSVCAIWFAYQTVYLQITIHLFELVLLVRVWALYKKDVKVSIFLGVVYVSEIGVMVYAGFHVNYLLRYDGTCLVENTPMYHAIILCVAQIVVQVIIWVMTWYKQANPFKEWQGPSYKIMVSRAFRDGLVVFLLFCTLFAVPTAYSLRVRSLTHSVFTLLTTVLSVAGCRVIINVQTLTLHRSGASPDSEVQLTSDFASSCFTTTRTSDAHSIAAAAAEEPEGVELEVFECVTSGTEPQCAT